MTRKFKNRYRNESLRLKYWDYGRNGDYFLTICTAEKKHFFGEIKNDKMTLTSAGKIAYDIWHLIPEKFPFAKLENFVVMPNHVHGILVIEKINELYDKGDLSEDPDMLNTMKTMVTFNSQNVGGITGYFNPMFQKNVSRVMRWYKGRCTFEIRKTISDFGWQPKFYDHIIRNEKSHKKISQYIIDNPKRWKEDKFNTE